MVLPIIICLLKPNSPMCKDPEPTMNPLLNQEEEDLSQQELLQYGGIGFTMFLLVSLLTWMLSKLVNNRQRAQRLLQEDQANELKEIRRSIREDGRKLI